MSTKYEICSRALVSLGASAIASFDDGTTESDTAALLYESVVQYMLSRYPWRFATTHRNLGAPLAEAPQDSRWSRQHVLPAGVCRIQTITLHEQPIRFDRYEDRILSDLGVNDRATLVATMRISEDRWPPYFEAALEAELAWRFANPITRSAELAAAHQSAATLSFAEAKTADAMGRTAPKIQTGRLTAFR